MIGIQIRGVASWCRQEILVGVGAPPIVFQLHALPIHLKVAPLAGHALGTHQHEVPVAHPHDGRLRAHQQAHQHHRQVHHLAQHNLNYIIMP